VALDVLKLHVDRLLVRMEPPVILLIVVGALEDGQVLFAPISTAQHHASMQVYASVQIFVIAAILVVTLEISAVSLTVLLARMMVLAYPPTNANVRLDIQGVSAKTLTQKAAPRS